MAFDELLKHLENPDWDVIVFDTPQLDILYVSALPEIIEKWADKIIRMHRLTGGIRALMFGAKEGEKMREERSSDAGFTTSEGLVQSEVTRFTLVTIPEKMGVNETIRAHQSLAEFNLPVTDVPINRMTPDLDHSFIQTRRENERKNVAELKAALPV